MARLRIRRQRVLTLLMTPLAVGLLAPGHLVSVDISSVFFVQLVAAICALSMALVIREAMRVAAENQSFVR